MSAVRCQWSVRLTLEHCDTVVQALSELPFKTVFKLIGDLNGQARRQFGDGIDPSQPRRFEFDAEDLACIVKALGELPFKRVHTLLASLHEQMQAQATARGTDDENTGGQQPATSETPAEADHAGI